MIAAIKALLSIVSLLMRWADERQLKELGKDELVKDQLLDLVQRTDTAKKIAADILHLSDDDVDDLLQNYYRD